MAIFYKHIKGCSSGSTGVAGSTTDLWTWIKWANISSNSNLTTASVNELPSIWLNKSNVLETEPGIDAGKIITSKASNQTIDSFFKFNAGIRIDFDQKFLQSTEMRCETDETVEGYTLETNSDLWLAGSSLILADSKGTTTVVNNYDEPFGHVFFINEENGVLEEVEDAEGEDEEVDTRNKNVLKIVSNTSVVSTGETPGAKQGQILFQAKRHTFDGHIWAQNSLYVGGRTEREEDSSLEEGVIKATQKCEALYFNATSDSRAKTNITPAKFSALSVVNNLPIYTFNYLSNPEKLTVGLIAQEAAQHDLDGFNMVDNLNATGLNNDMMQMKESKLVYILWKAVQELSAEVEDLKSQIHNLK